MAGIYWKHRAEAIQALALQSAERVEKIMSKIYEKTATDIQKEIEAFYGRYAVNNQLTLADVHKRLNPEELKKVKHAIKTYYDYADAQKIRGKMSKTYRSNLRLLSARAYLDRLESLKIDLQRHCFRLGVEEQKELKNGMSSVYKDARMRSAFELDAELGFSGGYSVIDDTLIDALISKEWLGSNYISRMWINKQALMKSLETDFISGVVRGWNVDKIAKQMFDNVGSLENPKGGFAKFKRLARTEFSHIAAQAKIDELKKHHIGQYEFHVNHGVQKTGEPCGECESLDGQHFELKYAETGVNLPPIHCCDKETEVLTAEGWKFFKDCSEKDTYASLNPTTGEIEYVKARKVIKQRYNSVMFRFHNEHFDMNVTDGHKIPIKLTNKIKNNDILLFEAKYAPRKSVYIPRGGNWIGESPELIQIGKYKIPAKDYLYVLALFYGFGYVAHFSPPLGYQGFFCVNNKVVKKLKKILPFDINPAPDNAKCAVFDDSSVCDYLFQYSEKFKNGKGFDFIKNLSAPLLRYFLSELIKDTGFYNKCILPRKGRSGKRLAKAFTCITKDFADSLGEIILKAGYYPEYYYDGNLYYIEVRKKLFTKMDKIKVDMQSYDDYVYCVNLERNHIIYIRRNGLCTWTGNCNCFCYTTAYFDDAEEIRQETLETGGRVFDIDKNISFDKWKEKCHI